MATRKRKRRSARRVTRKRRNYWPNNAAGHAKAARKGWRARKRKATARKRKTTRRKRRNPRAMSYMPKRRNPARKRRTYRRRARRNPKMFKGIIPTQRTIRQAVKIGTGVASGFASAPLLSRLMSMANLARYDNLLGLGQILLGSVMVGTMKNRNVKDVGMMIAGFGVYDLVASNLKRGDGTYWMQPLPRLQGLTSAVLPEPQAQEAASASYGVSTRPTSPIARAGVAASYQSPEMVGASFEDPTGNTVGLACATEAMGHFPGIDFDA